MNTDDSDLLTEVTAVLSAHPEIRLALLFGSSATDRMRWASDVDLAIDLGRPIDAAPRMSLMTELAARTGRPVDLIDLRCAGEPLLGQILKGGKRILGSTDCYADLIKRHLFDEADFMPYVRRILQERRHAWIGM